MILKTLVLFIVGTVLLSNIVVYVVKVVLPYLGSLPGHIYLFFDWAIFFIKQSTQATLKRINDIFNLYVWTFQEFASAWILYNVFKILTKSAKFGPWGMAVGVGLATAFSVIAGIFFYNVNIQVSIGKEKMENYINEIEGLMRRSLNPSPYWMYFHVVAKRNVTLGEYLKGIFRAYFFSKQKEVFSGKISSITFIGNHTCSEIEKTVSLAFNSTVRDDAFLLFNCTGSGRGNFSVEIFSLPYYLTFNVSSEDPNVPNKLKEIISDKVLKEENGISNFDNYTCYFDVSVDNFIANITYGYDRSEVNISVSPIFYCEVWVSENNLKYKMYTISATFLFEKSFDIRDYLMGIARNNMDLEGITNTYARIKRIGDYKVIPAKLYYEIIWIQNQDIKDIFINYYLGNRELNYLIIIAKKV